MEDPGALTFWKMNVQYSKYASHVAASCLQNTVAA